MRTQMRLFAAMVIFSMLALACGQKPGVRDQITGTGGQSGFQDEFGAGGQEGGELLDPGTEGVEGTEGGQAGTTTTRGGGGQQPGQQGGGGGGGGAGDRTGVSDNEIIVGVHAPVTGAAPFPTKSFEDGRDVYWERNDAPTIHGRKVKILFENDDYNPPKARDVCRKMAEQQKAFLLVGGGGTDQIQACAQYAASRGIPYLSPGVTEVGLAQLRNYFAVSMSYKQQGELLWQMITSDQRLSPGQNNVAMVRTNTPNFDDARQAFLASAKKRGKTLVLDETLPKNPSQNDYNNMAVRLAEEDAQVVYILTAPTHYVQLTARLAPGYRPWWIGVGITKGLNAVLETGCGTSNNAIDKGLFFSPFPGLDRIDGLDPAYQKAYQQVNGRQGDDLGLALWGLNKSLHLMLDQVGRDLTRQGFMQKMSTAQVQTNVFPPLRYQAGNPFGASQVHLLKANCTGPNAGKHTTEKLFASGF